uniref:NADH-ubiquinone oxidoreductase chain 2 n=1 Tax=Euseius sacchari TaxID=3061191 RepID=A0AAU6PCL8_9ACAR
MKKINKSIMKLITKMLFLLIFFMTLSTMNMFIVWFFMEFIIITMIPMHTKNNNNNYNCLMKYYLIQSISSCLFVMLVTLQYKTIKMNPLMENFLMNLILLIKLGLFPFSSWYFQVTENLEWKMWFLINTFQKIIPIWLMSNFINTKLMNWMIMMNSLYSVMEMTNQNSMRWLMNSSSLNHLSWIIVSMNSYSSNWETYMMVYILMSMNMYMMVNNYNYKTLMNTFMMKMEMKILFCINLMNFMSLPPMLGFLPKIFIINSINNMYIVTSLLLVNIMMMFYYIFMMKNMMINVKNSMININRDIIYLVNVCMLSSILMLFMYTM